MFSELFGIRNKAELQELAKRRMQVALNSHERREANYLAEKLQTLTVTADSEDGGRHRLGFNSLGLTVLGATIQGLTPVKASLSYKSSQSVLSDAFIASAKSRAINLFNDSINLAKEASKFLLSDIQSNLEKLKFNFAKIQTKTGILHLRDGKDGAVFLVPTDGALPQQHPVPAPMWRYKYWQLMTKVAQFQTQVAKALPDEKPRTWNAVPARATFYAGSMIYLQFFIPKNLEQRQTHKINPKQTTTVEPDHNSKTYVVLKKQIQDFKINNNWFSGQVPLPRLPDGHRRLPIIMRVEQFESQDIFYVHYKKGYLWLDKIQPTKGMYTQTWSRLKAVIPTAARILTGYFRPAFSAIEDLAKQTWKKVLNFFKVTLRQKESTLQFHTHLMGKRVDAASAIFNWLTPTTIVLTHPRLCRKTTFGSRQPSRKKPAADRIELDQVKRSDPAMQLIPKAEMPRLHCMTLAQSAKQPKIADLAQIIDNLALNQVPTNNISTMLLWDKAVAKAILLHQRNSNAQVTHSNSYKTFKTQWKKSLFFIHKYTPDKIESFEMTCFFFLLQLAKSLHELTQAQQHNCQNVVEMAPTTVTDRYNQKLLNRCKKIDKGLHLLIGWAHIRLLRLARSQTAINSLQELEGILGDVLGIEFKYIYGTIIDGSRAGQTRIAENWPTEDPSKRKARLRQLESEDGASLSFNLEHTRCVDKGLSAIRLILAQSTHTVLSTNRLTITEDFAPSRYLKHLHISKTDYETLKRQAQEQIRPYEEEVVELYARPLRFIDHASAPTNRFWDNVEFIHTRPITSKAINFFLPSSPTNFFFQKCLSSAKEFLHSKATKEGRKQRVFKLLYKRRKTIKD
jgi:hypothetical protein